MNSARGPSFQSKFAPQKQVLNMNLGIMEILLLLLIAMANIAILVLIVVGAIFIYKKLSSR